VIRPFKRLKRELSEVVGQLPDFSGIGPVYLVGGSLRDRILRRPSRDHDFVVPGDAKAFAQSVAVKHGSRVIEMGKGKRPVYRVVSGDNVLDFSPLHGKSIDDDLMNRDFTINGLGLDLGSENLIDPVGGRDDITSGTIRLISRQAILADPLRMLRAFRLGAVLGFDITPQTLSAIADRVPLVARSAGERIKSELFGLMEAERSFPYLKQMSEVGLLGQIIPELESCYDCPPGDHEQSIFAHVMRTYEEMEALLTEYPYTWPQYAEPMHRYLERNSRKALLKLASLFHDLGKPSTYSTGDTGRVRYLTHEDKGALVARDIFVRLKMSGQERSYVDLIVRNHLHPLHLFDARQRGVLTKKGIVRFFTRHKDHVLGLLLHSLADQRAKVAHNAKSEERFVAFLDEIFQGYFNDFRPTSTAPPLISGKDLIDHFGLTPSKRFGKLLRSVEEARLNGEIETREEAFNLVESLVSEKQCKEIEEKRDR
jgi:tRNA nucleotidyltransferase/poly(A) polymerase